MKNLKLFQTTICLLSTILLMTSCTKQISTVNAEQETQNAINEIRKIIGSEGSIKVIENLALDGENINSLRILSLNEFKNVYNELHYSKLNYKYKKFSSNNSKLFLDSNNASLLIKKDDYDNLDLFYPFLEDSSRPGAAGYHHAQFSPFSNLNKDLGGYYTLHLYFNTDSYGRIIGNPTISYTGAGIYSWQQINMSTISFNPTLLTSNFTITGIGLYGIQVGGMTLGWSEIVNFRIRIDMNQSVDKQVSLQQNQ